MIFPVSLLNWIEGNRTHQFILALMPGTICKSRGCQSGWLDGGDAVNKTGIEEAIKQSIAQWTGSLASVAAFTNPDIIYDPANAEANILPTMGTPLCTDTKAGPSGAGPTIPLPWRKTNGG